ncbi:Sesquipedalian-1 [Halotydeus destructor]|nr:Sesquipedalian-1 [Halotydeus destructor]
MKVNEKSLAKLATSSSRQPDLQGYLYKRGSVNKSFQKRWCVLKGNIFYYFEKKSDKEPLGCIVLEGCRLEVADAETELYSFIIAFAGSSSREYVLGTDSQENMETWMKALACASFDFLRAMVSQLKKQLDEITKTEKTRQELLLGNGNRCHPFNLENYNDLTDFGAATTNQRGEAIYTRKPFSEVHEPLSSKFRQYFAERKPKRPARGVQSSPSANQIQSLATDTLLDFS